MCTTFINRYVVCTNYRTQYIIMSSYNIIKLSFWIIGNLLRIQEMWESKMCTVVGM